VGASLRIIQWLCGQYYKILLRYKFNGQRSDTDRCTAISTSIHAVISQVHDIVFRACRYLEAGRSGRAGLVNMLMLVLHGCDRLRDVSCGGDVYPIAVFRTFVPWTRNAKMVYMEGHDAMVPREGTALARRKLPRRPGCTMAGTLEGTLSDAGLVFLFAFFFLRAIFFDRSLSRNVFSLSSFLRAFCGSLLFAVFFPAASFFGFSDYALVPSSSFVAHAAILLRQWEVNRLSGPASISPRGF